MTEPSRIEARGVARGILYMAWGHVLPLLVAIAALPFIVRGLGTERYGILALAWAVLGYMAILDLGLGPATTKFVSEELAKREDEEAARSFWSSVVIQLFLGLVGAALVWFASPWIAAILRDVPEALRGEAVASFRVLAFFVPHALVYGSVGGALRAAQKFGTAGVFQSIIGSGRYGVLLVGVMAGWGLPAILLLVLAWQLAGLAVLFLIAIRLVPGLLRGGPDRRAVPKLLRFGKWIAVSSVIGPILVYLDRFVLGTVASVAAVAYYAAPYSVVTKMSLFSATLGSVLFPSYAAMNASRQGRRVRKAVVRSLKFTLIMLVPVAAGMVLFAGDLMRLWLGAEFESNSTAVLQVLSVGVLINSLALVPYHALLGLDRPNLVATFHLAELPVYIPVLFVMVASYGAVGAAWAWTFRVTLDAVLLFGAMVHVAKLPARELVRGLGGTLAVLGVTAALIGLPWVVVGPGAPFYYRPIIFALGLVVFAVLGWTFALDSWDRNVLWRMVGRSAAGGMDDR